MAKDDDAALAKAFDKPLSDVSPGSVASPKASYLPLQPTDVAAADTSETTRGYIDMHAPPPPAHGVPKAQPHSFKGTPKRTRISKGTRTMKRRRRI